MTFQDFTWRSADGLSLYARDYAGPADKLPVICIPGVTRNSRDFEESAPWIAAQGRRVLAVDLRGRGRSSWQGDPAHYAPGHYAKDMIALLKAIGAERAIFVGTSLGGIVIMTLAARHRRLIAGAVINDVGPKIGAAGLQRIASYAGKGAPVRTWDDAAAYAKRINEVAFPSYGDADWRAFARRLFKESDGGVPILDYDPRVFRRPGRVARLIGPWLAWRSFTRLARGRPLLLVRGALSDLLEPSTVARMHRLAPKMIICEVPGVGHGPMLTEAASRAALLTFLQSAP